MAISFGGLGNMGGLIIGVLWFVVGLFFALIVTVLVVVLVAKAKEIPVYELDMVTRRLKVLKGRERKTRDGKKHIFIMKYKKFLPQIQSKDKYLQGKKDSILLVKDNNGLHHTARLPSLAEYQKMLELDPPKESEQKETVTTKIGFFKAIKGKLKGINSEEINSKTLDIISKVYLMPNPAEDLDWLASQAIQADREYAAEWWKSPTVLMIGTVFVCAFTFIITLIIAKRM